MDVNVKVTVDLGEKTLTVLSGLLGQNATTAKPVAELFPTEKADAPADEAPAPAKSAETRVRRSAAQIAADKAAAEAKTPAKEEAAPAKEEAREKPADFADLDEEAQAEEIKTMVTRNVKKGKSADVKKMLAHFEASRASELAPDQYGDFYEMIKAYGAGASVDSLTALD